MKIEISRKQLLDRIRYHLAQRDMKIFKNRFNRPNLKDWYIVSDGRVIESFWDLETFSLDRKFLASHETLERG